MSKNWLVSLDLHSRSGTPQLGTIKIAAPCQAEWKWMYGDDRVRFCGQCNLNVFNLSAMTKEEAEDLIRRADGRLCVRFYQRSDGTILTKNCPVGLQAIMMTSPGIWPAAPSSVTSNPLRETRECRPESLDDPERRECRNPACSAQT